MADELENNYWHPAFVGAIEIEFRSNKDDLEYHDEHTLAKGTLQIDLLVIKRDKGATVDNQIGEIFRTYNIFEFKSPDDGLSIDDYYKTLAYTYLYKSLGATVDAIPADELTVTMIRDAYPRRMFESVEQYGGFVEETHPGIFRISGLSNTPSQVVVTRRLDPDEHAALRVLTKRATRDDALRFLRLARSFTEQGDSNNANAVLQPSISANRRVYEEVRGEDPFMNEVLRDMFKDELQEEIRAFDEAKLRHNEEIRAFDEEKLRHNEEIRAFDEEKRKIEEEIRAFDEQISASKEELRTLKEEKRRIIEENQRSLDNAVVAMLRNLMKTLGLDATKAMNSLGIPPADQARLAALL